MGSGMAVDLPSFSGRGTVKNCDSSGKRRVFATAEEKLASFRNL
jgi:hypothetical protein